VPLTKSGANVLASMQTDYGPDKGKRIFYATANKKPQLGAKWHGQLASRPTARPISKR
jgi:lysophospholipid acyltransferase (LPLAT)-like uncharacterized protein